MKNVSDQLLNLSIELFNWETRNEQLTPADELNQVKELLRGTSDVIASQMNKLPNEIRRVIKVNQQPNNIEADCKIDLKIELPPQLQQVLEVFHKYYRRKGLIA